MPLVGFLPIDDRRVQGTIRAIESDLLHDGFLARYENDEYLEGIPGREGAFLACTFWLADCMALSGRAQEAKITFERLLAVRSDVGLLAEEYDAEAGRLTGNYPQAFSHVSLIDTARNLSPGVIGPAERRRRDADGDVGRDGDGAGR